MKQEIEDIKAIREMMERSTKFLSLSGMAGILAGLTAIAGAAFAYFYLLRDPSLTDYNQKQELLILFADALLVLSIAVGISILLTWRKARRHQQPIITKVFKDTLYHFSLPLVAGGLFCLILLARGELYLAIAGTLLFYGIALINVSKYTFKEIHYLGIIQILLGLAAALLQRYGLLFWTIGFGLCHILYGFILYRKYDLIKK